MNRRLGICKFPSECKNEKRRKEGSKENFLLVDQSDALHCQAAVDSALGDDVKKREGGFQVEIQGFNPSSSSEDDTEPGEDEISDTVAVDCDWGPSEKFFGGILFKRGGCYSFEDPDHSKVIVGLRYFILDDNQPPMALCTRTIPVTQTCL